MLAVHRLIERTALATAAVLAVALGWTGCAQPPPAPPLLSGSSAGETSSGESSSGADDTDEGPQTRAVDVLFVIDNGRAMGGPQARLAAAGAPLLAGLDQLGLHWRIGFTTTDNGNPTCGSTSPEAGRLQLSSCRAHTGDFVFNGSPPTDATASACTDRCPLDELVVQPTTTAQDDVPSQRLWLEPGNLPAGVTAAQAFACAAPQGIAGCGFGSPLESGHKALLRAALDDEAQHGFVRDDALLVVVYVTDGVDCSYVNDFQSIFLEEGAVAFWSDPAASAPTAAVCWNAGVWCSGGPGSYDECHAENRDVEGNVGVSDEQAVLQPVARYRDRLAELEFDKQGIDPAARVLVAVIGGVPPGYDQGTSLVYADASDSAVQLELGIGPGCVQPDASPVAPPVRLRELAESFAPYDASRNLWSVCDPSYDDAIAGILAMIEAHVAPTDGP